MEWQRKIPWSYEYSTGKYGKCKMPNPLRFPMKLLREILNKEVKLKITDEGDVMCVTITD